MTRQALLAIVASLCALPAFAADKIDFAHEVVPILKAKCAKCHTNGSYKGSLSFDTRADLLKKKAAVPGKSAESEMIRRVLSKDPETRMPPDGPALTEKEVATLRRWIDDGLPWDEGFSFKARTYSAPLKPRRPTVPPGDGHPIDRIVNAYWTKNKVTAPANLDDGAFVRRAYLDLIGQLPTPGEVQAFAANAAPNKHTALIGSLLNEKRAYTDHWMAFWNDHLRNEYKGTGYIDGGRMQITSWLYKSLLDNKPYNQFVRELIVPTPGAEGFTRGIKWRGEVNASQVVELQFAQNVGQIFFGANIKCASCHDSFIDDWKLNDAYGLAAVIATKPLTIHRCDKPLDQVARPQFLFPELGEIDAKLPPAKRLERLADLVVHPGNGRFTRTIANRMWDRLIGRGIVFPVDVMGNRPWSEDLLDYLATYLVDQQYDLKKLLEHIATSQVYRSRAVSLPSDDGGEYLFRGPELKRLSAEQFVDAVWQITGTAPAKAVAPAAIPAFDTSCPDERRMVRATLVDCDSLMRSLGRPNREQVVTTRPEQLSTLQALDLANGQVMANLLARGAANMLKASPMATREAIVDRLYQTALSRRPTPGEAEAAAALLGTKPTAESIADLTWAIIMLPEFQLVR